MAPKSYPEAEETEEDSLPSLVSRRPTKGHRGSPAVPHTGPLDSSLPSDGLAFLTHLQ